MAAERGQLQLADDGHHRLMVELRVVETVQQMDRTRSRGREAHADLAGELRLRAGHERGHFLMARLHEGKLALDAPERAHNAVDAVAGITVDARNAPLLEPLQHEICGGLAHGAVLMVGCNMTSRPQDGRRLKDGRHLGRGENCRKYSSRGGTGDLPTGHGEAHRPRWSDAAATMSCRPIVLGKATYGNQFAR